MSPALRLAALAAAGLALASCASSGGGGAGGEGEETKSERATREAKDAVNPRGKAALYRRITQLTDAWMQAYTGTGENSAEEARSIGTAVSREVWERFDEVVEDLATSDNPRWRIAAARGLGFVQNPRVRPALENALDDKDPSVLAAALTSLARGAAAETDDARVARLLSFPDKIVASDAALCLARVFQSRRAQGMEVLDAARVQEVETDLQVLLLDPTDPILRGTAAQALGELRSPAAEDALLNRVRDDHAFVRLKVGRALALAGTPKGYEILLDALGRETLKNVQTVTALAIGSVAEREGRKPPYAELGTDAAAWRRWLKK